MHYALDPRTFFYSHYFHLGLRFGVGLVGVIALAMWLTDIHIAMSIGIGALCTALMDMPSPLRHKFNEMMASVLLCTAVTLLISLCGPYYWLLMPMLVAVSFFASMMVVYGKKSMPLQLATLFIMTMSTEHTLTPVQSFAHAGLFMFGGLSYLAYAMGISYVLRHRIKQQVLAEALFELAAYIDIKADFYDTRYNLTEQFNKLVRHQALLADRQQASRDLILRAHNNRKDAVVVQIHVCMLDLYEQVLATHTDYAALRTHLLDSPALRTLHDLAYKAARDIESVAYAVTRKRASYPEVDYTPELKALDQQIAGLQDDLDAGKPRREAVTVLRAQRNKITAIIRMIGELHVSSQKVYEDTPFWRDMDMQPFLSQQKYELQLMVSHFRMDSPVFRFALRVSMAIAAGLAIGAILPYKAHSYWIVLTIVIILKPSFSMTKQRRSDRIVGTIIGCIITAVVLKFTPSPAAILAVLVLATIATPTFIYLRYRYAAIAVSVMILLWMYLVAPSSNLISERLVDTFVGAAIATAFSFVLANWEYQSLPHLVKLVLTVNLSYMEASFDLLQGKYRNDFIYRIQRKRLMETLAALSAALVRMLDEPESKQRAAEDINLFIVQNYLLVAHVAALRAILRRHVRDIPSEAVNAMLEASHATVCRTLSVALSRHTGATPPAAPLRREAVAEPDVAWSGWPLVQRRIRLLQADADKIIVHSEAIVRNVANGD
ncbi:FUSC family protein [Pseudoduganella eburnea]|uniref:FUSC family protein n=1 Tax=Massilia eburnea TaxID=1776165 RepID=A0A6L6QJM7_9BURK|nr:FUSC family membrane protein [Massilia eburnea]MTW12361.1 FUSC family protein [Massilia eburnea]